MNVHTIDNESFSSLVEREGIVVVDCWAPWCAACRDFEPVFTATAQSFPDHLFTTLNTDAESTLVDRLGIHHVPALLLFRDGILLFKQPGYMDERGLRDVVAQAEDLDMAVVRAQLEVERKSA